jgi:hypothetical protein
MSRERWLEEVHIRIRTLHRLMEQHPRPDLQDIRDAIWLASSLVQRLENLQCVLEADKLLEENPYGRT